MVDFGEKRSSKPAGGLNEIEIVWLFTEVYRMVQCGRPSYIWLRVASVNRELHSI
jgi:hypothetical protein